MTDARERLADAIDVHTDTAYDYVLGTPEREALIDALLAHPDDLIALLVERGALEQVGWTRYFPGDDSDDGGYDGLFGYVFTDMRADPATSYAPFSRNAWTPVYRQVREEAQP